jgi:hypothetical protein
MSERIPDRAMWLLAHALDYLPKPHEYIRDRAPSSVAECKDCVAYGEYYDELAALIDSEKVPF